MSRDIFYVGGPRPLFGIYDSGIYDRGVVLYDRGVTFFQFKTNLCVADFGHQGSTQGSSGALASEAPASQYKRATTVEAPTSVMQVSRFCSCKREPTHGTFPEVEDLNLQRGAAIK